MTGNFSLIYNNKMKATQLVALLCCIAAISTKSIKPHIIGGADARAGQFPYAAAITVRTSAYSMFCGGTLISNQWVLTAGQCVKDAIQFTIKLGSINLSGTDSDRVTVNTSTYVLHPEYNATTLANDIGLIKLNLPITFTDYIKAGAVANYDVGQRIRNTAIGWGQTSDDQAGTSNTLQYAVLYTYSNEECQLIYGSAVQDNMVCASGNFNEGTCIEDTGSPLVLVMGAYHWIVGVSSFISGNGCESTDPSGFTRVVPYKDWIKNVTAEA